MCSSTPGRALDLGRGPGRNGRYDLIYDSGCFQAATFALTCFAAGGMGSEIPDADFYRRSRLEGVRPADADPPARP